jgi:anaerobic magnesium-protoporphyrin IX monomethyl ester cyclase
VCRGITLRVVLVYVGTPESRDRPVMTPPIGTQLLAAVAQRDGFDVQLFDSRLATEAEMLAAIDNYDPRLVGFSFLSPSAPRAERLAEAVRQQGRVTIAGGVHASLHSSDLLARDVFDCIVRKEGENAFLDICRLAAAGLSAQPLIDGAQVENLDSLPSYPDLDCYRQVYDDADEYRSIYVQLGRGCPMNCGYCELPSRDAFDPFNKRFRSIDRVMADVHKYVVRWGINFVTIVDSIATLNMRLVEAFARRMDDELPSVGFMFNGHANRFGRELAAVLGGLQQGRPPEARVTVWFGFESGSQKLLDFMHKATTVERGISAANLCHEYDVQLGANLLIGVPTEDDADYDAHHQFMDAIRPTFPNPNILNPLPGTAMHDYCVQRNLLRDPADLSIWLHTEIEQHRTGPIRGVDYQRVLREYYRYHPEDRPQYPAYDPWASAS